VSLEPELLRLVLLQLAMQMPMFLLLVLLGQLLRILVFLALPVLPSTGSSPISGWWTTASADASIHDSSSSKWYGATDFNEEAITSIV